MSALLALRTFQDKVRSLHMPAETFVSMPLLTSIHQRPALRSLGECHLKSNEKPPADKQLTRQGGRVFTVSLAFVRAQRR